MSGARVGRQRTLDGGDQAAHTLRRRLPHLARLTGHLRRQRGDRATVLGRRQVAVGQVVLDQRAKGARALRLANRCVLGDAGGAVLSGPLDRLAQQRVARSEVRIEAAVGQPCLLHDVRHADAVETGAADRPRRGLDDAVVGDLLAAGRRVHLRSIARNMMIVIFIFGGIHDDARSLLRLDAARLDHACPEVGLRIDVSAELLGRPGRDDDAELA